MVTARFGLKGVPWYFLEVGRHRLDDKKQSTMGKKDPGPFFFFFT